MIEKIIHFEGVGDILFRHSSRARHLNISVRPFAGVRISIPIGMSYNSAIRLVTEKKLWIKQHLDKLKEFEKQQTLFDENSGYCTKHHKLYLRKVDRKNISVRISKEKINIVYLMELNSNSIEVQIAIRKGIERALKLESKQYLPDKVSNLTNKFGFNYNKLTLKKIKSRWGNCSRKKYINLSIHLMRLPDHLIDYVILHELVHTVHHDHSKRFWAMLDKVTGGAKSFDKELRKYRIAIY
ncbi:MAG: SprT family zinc-dependent metalloprotease [Ignavibacteria bacterium]|nr:SprT family zinc-dependent metalloprotease [Ignavibacteria bacterium]